MMMARGMTATAGGNELETPERWGKLHLLALAALLLRLAVAWWSVRITHPDELFQYLEQAHRLVYGYGVVPWEFRFAARNWLLPGSLALLLEGLRAMGLDRPMAYIPALKSLFGLVSVCLIYASYSIGRNMFGERTGRLAAVLAAIWYELLYVATVATPEVLSTYALVGAVAVVTARSSTRRAAIIGLLLGISVALRLQYALPAAALWILVVVKWQWRCAWFAAGTAAAVIGFAGLIDYWSWGTAFISYYNSVNFNVLLGKADVFGRRPPYAYLFWLGAASVGLHLLAIGYGALQWRRCWPILLLLVCVLVPHSLIAHKEYRFVILAVPLLLILWADALVNGLHWLRPTFGGPRTLGAIIATVATLSVAGCVLRGVFSRDDRLLATLDLSRRSDVAAVLDLSGFWFRSGGCYFLHHDVPLYFEPQITAEPLSAVRSLVSHVLVPVTHATIPGFRVSARYGSIAILEQVAPPPLYRRLAADGREPREPGLEGGSAPRPQPK
jgi:hypothetical protein